MFLGFLNKIQTKRIDINVLVVAVIVNVLGLRSIKIHFRLLHQASFDTHEEPCMKVL